ncbi:cytochrome P450 [Yinghuangia aomiensis]
MTEPERRINLLDRDWYAGDPSADYAWLRDNAPVYYSEEAGAWGLTRHADVSFAERNPEIFSSANGSRPVGRPQPSMIDSDDPQHYRRRKPGLQGFTPRQVNAMEDHVREIVKTLIARMLAQPERKADLVRQFAAPLPMTMIGEMLGVDHDHLDQLQHWADVMVMLSDGGELSYKAGEAFTEYVEYTTKVIENRRANPDAADLIGILVHAEIDGEKLDFSELIGESLLLLVGGNETTRNVISGGLAQLMKHPDQMARLREDPSLIPTAVEECLRWVSPVVNMARTTTRDVELHGVTIPARRNRPPALRRRQPRHRAVRRAGVLRRVPHAEQPHRVRQRTALLPRLVAGPAGDPRRLRGDPQAAARPLTGGRRRTAPPPQLFHSRNRGDAGHVLTEPGRPDLGDRRRAAVPSPPCRAPPRRARSRDANPGRRQGRGREHPPCRRPAPRMARFVLS